VASLTESQIKLLVISSAIKMRPRFVVTEVAFSGYRARADILIGFGRLIGVEVKTFNDRFDRLPAQMARYLSSFHASYVAYPVEARKKIPEGLSKRVGLIEVRGRTCHIVRKARIRKHVRPEGLKYLVPGRVRDDWTEKELLSAIESRFRKNYRAYRSSLGSVPVEEDLKLLGMRRTEVVMRLT